MLVLRECSFGLIDIALDEGAKVSNPAPQHERVDLAGSFVGVDRVDVGHEAPNVMVQQDSVPAQELTGPADGLAYGICCINFVRHKL